MNNHIHLGFTPESVKPGTHMCLIYNNEQERREVIGHFMSAGHLDGERMSYFADHMSKEEVEALFAEYDIDLTSEQFDNTYHEALPTYCPHGYFDPDEMMDRLRAYNPVKPGEVTPNCRVSGEMSWATRGIPGADRLIEYEARVTEVLERHHITAICQYDARLYSGAFLLDVMRVHPYMAVRNQVIANPYYEPAEIFLAKQVH